MFRTPSSHPYLWYSYCTLLGFHLDSSKCQTHQNKLLIKSPQKKAPKQIFKDVAHEHLRSSIADLFWGAGIVSYFFWSEKKPWILPSVHSPDILLVFLWHLYGIPMGIPWNFCRVPMGFVKDFYGISIGFLKEFLWTFHGMFMGFLWCVYATAMRFWIDFWSFFAISKKINGMSMEFL